MTEPHSRTGAARAAWALVAVAVAVLPTTSLAAAQRSAPRRPNVLIVMPDQWRGQDLGRAGNREVKTPNLDRLASEGLYFRNAFANTPVCCPARAVLLTGTYAHRNGMIANDLRLRESETTIAELLGAAGYRTGYVGKWHLDGGRRAPGFVPPGARREGFAYWAASECSHNHFHPTYFRDSDAPITEHRFEPEVWTDRAVEFLNQKGDDPFFLVVSMGPPHDPYAAPDRYMKLYDPAALTMRPNWVDGTSGGRRKDVAAYYAAITAVDDQVGRLLQALEESGKADDTLVVFLSDHGDMLGSQGRRLKRKPWEESIRVPLIVRWPARIKAGRTSDALISHVDLAPTLLALCGLPVPPAMQGANLADLVSGRAETGPDSVFFQIFVPFDGDGTPFPWRGVRTDRAMYARTEAGPWVLYDLENDPHELKDLAHDPARAALLETMERKLTDWMTRTGDSWSFNSMERVEDAGRLYRHETFYTIQEYLDWARAHPAADAAR